LFSKWAVINKASPYYGGGADYLDVGQYTSERHYPCLIFRLANSRTSQLAESRLSLLLLRRELFEDRTAVDPTAAVMAEHQSVERIHEMDYEVNNQLGRLRGFGPSTPLLPLPWTVFHVINEKSPLYGITPEMLKLSHFEIIAILEGIDESVSNNVQARYSYLPQEILFDYQFVSIVERNYKDGVYEIDYSKLNLVEPVRSPAFKARDFVGAYQQQPQQ